MSRPAATAVEPGTPGLTRDEKRSRYEGVAGDVERVLDGETDLIASMSTVASLLHAAFPHFSWTGFYRRVGPAELLIGPYQGSLGCVRIPFERGVCGAAARERRSIVVPDVDRFPGHIACDPDSRSEVVVPVFDADGELIAVLDVDSRTPGAFDEIDRQGLERIVALLGGRCTGPVTWSGGSEPDRVGKPG
jgi:L-methionine (R)-S-oxide reductase